jgi:purine catabolism regulator
VAALLARPGFGLRVLAGREHLHREISWAHVVELDNPVPWLEGGELLLTTGLGLPADEDAQRSYVRRLVAAGVAAVGFGVGLSYETVPPALVDEAHDRGLVLFEIPRPMPFLAITKEVAARLAAEQYETVQQAVDAQRRLTRAALDRATPGVLATLTSIVPAWALALDASGRVLSVQPSDARRFADAVRAEVARQPAGGRRFAISVVREGSTVTIQSLGTGERPRGYLAVGQPATPSAFDRLVIGHAASLVSLELDKSTSIRVSERQLRADLLRTILASGLGEAETARSLAAFGFGHRRPVTVLLLHPPATGSGVAEIVEIVEKTLVDLSRPFLLTVGETDGDVPKGDVVVLLEADPDEDGPTAAEQVCERLQTVLPGVRAGLGDAVPAHRARTSLTQATYAVRAGGEGLVRFRGIRTYAMLLGGHTRDGLEVIADALLGPLLDHDRTRRGDLVHSLRVFLAHNAQWETAATELGVHRHTLRHRIAKVEELTGRSLTSAQDRTEFWLALQARDLADSTD